MKTLLDVEDLSVQFGSGRDWTTVVSDISFSVGANSALGIVGESGSGKSVSALSILRLHAPRTSRISSGRILWHGQNLLEIPEREMRSVRGNKIAMIFQDPLSSLNPVITIGDQICEVLKLHKGMRGEQARRRAVELLDMVRIADAKTRLDSFPHQLSGGMRQRVMIAMAITCGPELLIADEPTTALDVTVQARIMDLIRDIRRELGMSLILISHDLNLVAEYVDRVLIMYSGQVVEKGETDDLFQEPVHPYAEGLIRAIPPIDRNVHRLETIPGTVPDPSKRMASCRFNPRCTYRQEECTTTPPPLLDTGPGHMTRCPPRARQLGFLS